MGLQSSFIRCLHCSSSQPENPPTDCLEHPEQSSIFKRPDPTLENDQTVHQPTNQAEPADQAAVIELASPSIEDQPILDGPDPLSRAAPRESGADLPQHASRHRRRRGRAGRRRRLRWLLLFSPDEPATVGAAPTPSLTPGQTAEPTIAATPEATATPEPTPEPTPAGLSGRAGGCDWATVTVDELEVHASAGEDQPSNYTLIGGAVVTVAEGPQAVNGQNWYRIASPVGPPAGVEWLDWQSVP